MSKIYEALLRAEQERTASSKQPPVAEQTAAGAAATAVETLPEPPLAEPSILDHPAVDSLKPEFAPPLREPLTAPILTEPLAPERHVFSRAVTAAPAPAVPAPTLIPGPSPENAALLPGEFSAGAIQPLDLTGIRVCQWKPILEKLPALEERGSAVEQFRSLRTRLFGFRDLNRIKSVMISSGLPREGKSFIAANLAVSFARHKASRVLLIDGDMRRSSQHIVFGTDRSPGLTTYLSGKASIVEVMQRARLNPDGSPLFSGLGSLTFIPGGEDGDKAADLAGSARFRQLMEAASPYFDWIIVDSSPVNLVTDGVNLAHGCDAVLMVARGGVTKFEAAQRALAELKGSKVLGVVLNAVDTPPSVEGYYGYSSYDSIEPAQATTPS